MSGLIYNIYTLDLPRLFHNKKHNSYEDRTCKSTSIKTYVDDIFPIVVADKGENLNNKIEDTIKRVSEYMDSNQLAVNVPKTKVLIVSNDKATKDDFKIKINDKEIVNSNEINVLGMKINNQLNWKATLVQGNDSLLNQLKVRNYTLKKSLNILTQI